MTVPPVEITGLLEPHLENLDPVPPADAANRLAALAEMVARWGARMNLSGHRSADEVARALIGDAIGLLSAIEHAVGTEIAGRVVDLGSGAGFPGLPFAILRPGAQVHMVEAREKRHYFQRAVRRDLAVANAHPILARIEAHPLADADWVVAQAVGPIEDVVRAMAPYAREGGRLVVPGSERLTEPPMSADFAGQVLPYRSPLLNQPRRFWLAARSRPSSRPDSP